MIINPDSACGVAFKIYNNLFYRNGRVKKVFV